MLSYFPRLYPDELLYSGLARYARHTGQSSRQAQMAVFGVAHQLTHPQFGFRISELAARHANIDSRSLLLGHTDFPYITAFTPSERTRRLRDLVIAGDRQTCRNLIMTSQKFRKEEGLHYCSECVAEAECRYGERYWRRVHQLSLVRMCPDHGSVLHVHPLKGANALRQLHPAMLENTTYREGQASEFDEATRDLLLELAKQSRDLLEGEQLGGWAKSLGQPGKVNEVLASKNYGFGPGRSNWRAVHDHAEQSLKWMKAPFPSLFRKDGSVGPWLKDSGTASSLPTEALQLTASVLQSLPLRPHAFGRGPWRCLNPLAPHFEALVVKDITRLRVNNVTQATFRCDCGYSYTQHEKADSTQSAPCFSSFGPTLKKHIQEAARRGWSITETARRARLAPSTLRKAMAMENINDVWKEQTTLDRDPTTGRFAGTPAQSTDEKKLAILPGSRRQIARELPESG